MMLLNVLSFLYQTIQITLQVKQFILMVVWQCYNIIDLKKKLSINIILNINK